LKPWRLVALKDFAVNGQRYTAGERFELPVLNGILSVSRGLARLVKDEPAKAAPKRRGRPKKAVEA